MPHQPSTSVYELRNPGGLVVATLPIGDTQDRPGTSEGDIIRVLLNRERRPDRSTEHGHAEILRSLRTALAFYESRETIQRVEAGEPIEDAPRGAPPRAIHVRVAGCPNAGFCAYPSCVEPGPGCIYEGGLV